MFSTLDTVGILKIIVVALFALGTISLAAGIFILFKKVMGDELKVIAREPENTIGEYVQQMWSAVGIKTKLVAMERLAWIDEVRAGKFDTCFWRGNFSYTAVDASTAAQRIGTGAGSNWSQFSDPQWANHANRFFRIRSP